MSALLWCRGRVGSFYQLVFFSCQTERNLTGWMSALKSLVVKSTKKSVLYNKHLPNKAENKFYVCTHNLDLLWFFFFYLCTILFVFLPNFILCFCARASLLWINKAAVGIKPMNLWWLCRISEVIRYIYAKCSLFFEEYPKCSCPIHFF